MQADERHAHFFRRYASPAGAGGLKLRCGVAAFADFDPLKEIDRLAAWGADYAEPALSKTAALSDAAFEAARRKASGASIRVETMNWFVPPDVRLTGPAVDGRKIRDFLEKALGRAEALGAKAVVLGSPGARNVPDGFPMERARGQLRDFLGRCADVIEGRKYGMVIAVEPLRRAESNIVNTTPEGVRLVREVNRPSIRLHVDYYHWAIEAESPDVLREAGGLVAHLHVATPRDRVFPKREADVPRLGDFLSGLKRIGYDGRISIEANLGNPEEDVRAGLALLRGMVEACNR
jgi:sugar phosphate isomerase/epimerase